MKLSIKDRLMMKELYPQQSNFINQMMVKEIDDKVRLGVKDKEKANFRVVKDARGNSTNQVEWDDKKEFFKDVMFTAPEMAFLKEQFDRKNKGNEITLDMVPLCQKIQDWKPAVAKKADESDT